MGDILVSDELAISLLDAAVKTALSHRGKLREEYAELIPQTILPG